MIDFEEELKKAFNPINSQHTSTIPKPQEVSVPIINDGIMIW